MSGRSALRRLVDARAGLPVPGAYDGVSARLVERAGFAAVYMTGFGTSASRLGLPDLGFAGLAEMAESVRQMAGAVRIPLIADADTGYGGALAVQRTVRAYEAAGAAALHLEDQVSPKRCGHLAGKDVVPPEEMVARIRAAAEARTDPDLLLIARTDAIAVTGFDDALERARAYARAGADVLFVEAPTTVAQVETIPKALDVPCLFNYAPGGKSPLPPVARLAALGYAIVLLPVQTLFVAARAIHGYLAALRQSGEPSGLDERLMAFAEFNELIGVPEMLARERRFRPAAE
ncbi:MAG: isocitrate lyase/PEP mutase family protein [Candidatus Rokuibacteriota bacterium]